MHILRQETPSSGEAMEVASRCAQDGDLLSAFVSHRASSSRCPNSPSVAYSAPKNEAWTSTG